MLRLHQYLKFAWQINYNAIDHRIIIKTNVSWRIGVDLWLRTDETEEAISCLEMLAEISPSLMTDIYRWKWAIIATHSSLQGFMVCALRQGNSFSVWNDKIAEQWLEANREGIDYPVEKLDNFLNLYKKVKSDRMLCYVQSKKFIASQDHNWSVKKLNELRNDFIHFVPKGWSLNIMGLPEICLNCLEVVEFLGWESGNLIFYEETQQQRALTSLKKAKKALNETKQKYEESVNHA